MSAIDTATEVQPATDITQDYTKRLMVFGGRASMELAAKIAGHLDVDLGAGHPEDLLRRRDLLPLRGVDPRRRRLPGPVHRRQRRRGHDPERRAGRAAGDDRRGPGRLRPPDHRRDALVRLRPPGQEVRAARADHGADHRPLPRAGRGRPGPDDGPARGPDPGLLRRPRRPHDRDADAERLRRQPRLRRGDRDRLARRRPREDRPELRPQDRDPLGGHGEGAARPAGRRDRLRGRRRQGQDRRPGRRHDRHRRHPHRRRRAPCSRRARSG